MSGSPINNLSKSVINKNFNKVIGIGLSKTGTASLAYALRLLGISCIHYPVDKKTIETTDAVVDGLVAVDFPYYDYQYPGSKFIYTIRNYDEWIASCKIHFELRLPPEVLKSSKEKIHKLFWENMFPVWGTDTFDEKIWKKAYENHQNIVKEYFEDRPDDLLIMNLCAGDGWEKLCPFLGLPVPKEPFPMENVTNNPFKEIITQSEKKPVLSQTLLQQKPAYRLLFPNMPNVKLSGNTKTVQQNKQNLNNPDTNQQGTLWVNTPAGKLVLNKDLAKPFYYKKAFTPEECERIINLPQTGKHNERSDKSLRVTNVKFIDKTPETEWIWQRIEYFVKLVNSNHYRFKISHIDNVHIMEYQKDCYFKWHIDINGNEYFALRQISVVIFLSDTNDYEGGNLLFDIDDENETPKVDMEQGSIILFPSFQIHKVSDIKSGTRRTLVAWVYGDSFT